MTGVIRPSNPTPGTADALIAGNKHGQSRTATIWRAFEKKKGHCASRVIVTVATEFGLVPATNGDPETAVSAPELASPPTASMA